MRARWRSVISRISCWRIGFAQIRFFRAAHMYCWVAAIFIPYGDFIWNRLFYTSAENKQDRRQLASKQKVTNFLSGTETNAKNIFDINNLPLFSPLQSAPTRKPVRRAAESSMITEIPSPKRLFIRTGIIRTILTLSSSRTARKKTGLSASKSTARAARLIYGLSLNLMPGKFSFR